VETFIGILELVGWILAVTALAAGVTYAVIKLFPAKEETRPEASTSTTRSG
jgi:hypothetical protein